MSALWTGVGKWLAPGVFFLIVAVVWEGVVRWYHLPTIILPPPEDVLTSLWRERWPLLTSSLVTLRAAASGLAASALIGTAIAILFSQSSLLRAALYPYVIFLQTVPIVAIAPLLIIWSGYNFRTTVIVACIISIFPIISNVTSGLISINENLRDLFRMQSASRLQTLVKLRIPAAVSHLILGLRISCGLSVIGALMAEFFVGNSNSSYDGLGTMMIAKAGNYRTAELMAAIIASTMLGVFLFAVVNLMSLTLLRRWTRSTGFESGQ